MKRIIFVVDEKTSSDDLYNCLLTVKNKEIINGRVRYISGESQLECWLLTTSEHHSNELKEGLSKVVHGTTILSQQIRSLQFEDYDLFLNEGLPNLVWFIFRLTHVDEQYYGQVAIDLTLTNRLLIPYITMFAFQRNVPLLVTNKGSISFIQNEMGTAFFKAGQIEFELSKS